jgi:hypothetical protein
MSRINKVLKGTSENAIKLNSLNEFLSTNGITLHQSIYNGIIHEINGKYYKYLQDGSYSEVVPPFIEGVYVECDINGNTDYYND